MNKHESNKKTNNGKSSKGKRAKFVKWDGQYSIDDSQPSSIHADNEFDEQEYDQNFDIGFQQDNECLSESDD